MGYRYKTDCSFALQEYLVLLVHLDIDLEDKAPPNWNTEIYRVVDLYGDVR